MAEPGFPPDGLILTTGEMGAADAAAIAAGVGGIDLMERAGQAAATLIRGRFPPVPVAVLAGPGNNGGDGFVIARRLAEADWPVRLGLLGEPARLEGDAAEAARRYQGDVEPLAVDLLEGAGLVVDALFGAGLARALEGAALEVISAVRDRGLPSVAVDVPSGVHGDTGEVLGAAAEATLTVTFHRPKPGHFLYPGRGLCGELVVVDIGIPDQVHRQSPSRLRANGPREWRLPRRTAESHKYAHGHALVVGGGPASSGAARMAALSALRTGAGAVTVLCAEPALPVYAAHLTAVMVSTLGEGGDLAPHLEDSRRNAVLLGPGGGVGEMLAGQVLAALHPGKACVLDADALTSFSERPERLFEAIGGECLLTPHEGEFRRLFDPAGDKLTRARRAAARSGAVVLLKGPDTVVAAPDGRAVIQPYAPFELATAGSGDVLAGIALGLLAQGLPAFEAGAAAVWLHGQAATGFGPGLIAEDLPERIPGALRAGLRMV